MAEQRPKPTSMFKAFVLVKLAYVVALCAAVGVGYAVGDRHPIVVVLAADVAATLVIYAFARFFRNASFYDPYWSTAPLVIALYYVIGTAVEGAEFARQAAVVTLAFIWGIRLTYNWASQWRGLKHEDWRYANFRRNTGRKFWFVELTGIEMIPTVVVFLACMSLYPALSSGTNAFGALDWVAIAVTGGAIVLEVTADVQMRRFLRENPEPGKVMDRGLWRYSRHPNYLGEISFWWGLFIFAMAADPSYWWCVFGPVAMTLLFLFISIPMIDKRHLERRPGYAEHMRKTSALLPWFPRK